MPWTLDGTAVNAEQVLEERRDWQQIRVTFRVSEAVRNNVLKQYDNNIGDFEYVNAAGGSYTAVERSDPSIAVTVEAPANRLPLRSYTDYLVENYTERLDAQSADQYIVEFAFAARTPKSDSGFSSVSASPTEWSLAFAEAKIATDKVLSDINKGGSSVGGGTTLEIITTVRETRIIENSCNRLAGVETRSVPDGQNRALDRTPNSRNTVSVKSPANRDPNENVIKSGDYVVTGWTTERLNDQRSKVKLNLLPEG